MPGRVDSSRRTLAGNRIGLTLRSVGSNNMFLLVFWHAVGQRVRRVYPFLLWGILGMAFFLAFRLLFCVLVCLGGASLASPPVAHKTGGYFDVPPAGHALWVEVGGGITVVTSGETAWQLIKLPAGIFGSMIFLKREPYMPALCGTAQSLWLFCMYGLSFFSFSV